MQVRDDVDLPFHDARSYEAWHQRKVALTRSGDNRAVATVRSISDVGTFQGRFVRVVAVRLQPDAGDAFDTTTVVVEPSATSPLPVGGEVPAFYDHDDHTMVAFAMPTTGGVNVGVDSLAQPARPRWKVPSQCPECGGPVDTAVACLAADPVCEHCHRPLPVEPLA
jgi:hypothetical protein